MQEYFGDLLKTLYYNGVNRLVVRISNRFTFFIAKGEKVMTYQTIYPYTGKQMYAYPNATDQEVNQALDTAHALYRKWRNETVASRKPQLLAIATLMKDRRQQLSEKIVYDMGKLLTEAQAEVDLCVRIVEYYAKNAEKMLQPVELQVPMGKAKYVKQATGIIMAVEPWNFPLYQIVRVFAPNYMVGNPMLLKDASICPTSAQAFADLVLEAGAPKGALTNLFIDYDQVARIIADDRVAGVCLTGSERGGASVAQEAGKNLKKATLELGGNDAFIVLADADWNLLRKVAPAARLDNAGQVCTSSKRFIVPAEQKAEFIELMQTAFSKLKMGNPMNPETTLAPLSSKAAQQKLQQQVDLAVQHGARLVMGGHAVAGQGFFFEPTILTDITPDNPIFDQELFGPVAMIYAVDSEDEAIKLANNSKFGLGGTVFSQNLEHAQQVASRIETGMTFINSGWDSIPEIPFGGVKHSGFGRELGMQGLDAFVNEHLIYIKD